ncbi:hypothetical protein Tco_1438712 [Tanacetum coccineum]
MYEHVGPEVTSSQDGKVNKMAKQDYAWLMISRCSRSHSRQAKEQAQDLKSMITTSNHKLMIEIPGIPKIDLARKKNLETSDREIIALEMDQKRSFQKSFLSKECLQAVGPKRYIGDYYEETNLLVILDSKETLLLAEESRSKMLLRQKDPIMLKKKVNTTPVDYAALNQLYKDFKTRFVPQTELSPRQAFWSQNSVNSPELILSSRPTIVEVPKNFLLWKSSLG